MARHTAKRIRFQNGERMSVLVRTDGLPVHEAVLFLGRYRTRGRAANTIHQVCAHLAQLHNALADQGINLVDRFHSGSFLRISELERLAQIAQLNAGDLDDDDVASPKANVINLETVRMRRKAVETTPLPVDPATHATKIRNFAAYLRYVSEYVAADLDPKARPRLSQETDRGLKALLAHVPRVSKRAKLGARQGLSKEDQDRVLAAVHPGSPTSPWRQPYVRVRNWLIVVLLLATGMRRGELLGLQIGDLQVRQPKVRIIRRADSASDPRTKQPNAKTYDREIELPPATMARLWKYINVDRHAIKRARRIPQVFVSDEGDALSESSIDKLFRELRQACPDLPGRLTSHVMRHTWNERFSEEAEAMGLSDKEEEKARSNQQGWVEHSKTAATYTRRHTERKGREVSLRLQQKLEDGLDGTD